MRIWVYVSELIFNNFNRSLSELGELIEVGFHIVDITLNVGFLIEDQLVGFSIPPEVHFAGLLRLECDLNEQVCDFHNVSFVGLSSAGLQTGGFRR